MVGLYHTKRVSHQTDSLGRISEDTEDLSDLLEPPGWNAESKLLLAKTVVARELGVSVETVTSRLASLALLLPSLATRFDTLRPGDLARLAAAPDVAGKLVSLRRVFPRADLQAMLAKRPGLLLMPSEEIADRAAALRLLMPGVDVDACAAEQPRLLDVEVTRKALAELGRLISGQDPVLALARDTSLMSMVDSGEDMILYDNGWSEPAD
jgi:hypothetical protein